MTETSAEPLHVVITGATGSIGQGLHRLLSDQGHRITRITRRPPEEGDVQWDPDASVLDGAALEGVDAVVHLAGESIAGGRWTAEKRERILQSRRRGTALLASTLANLNRPPRVLVSASAIGYYGDRGDEVLSDDAGPGEGFLPSVCLAWEQAADPARAAGIRVVHPRIGIVQDPDAGALQRSLPLFRLGLGGRFGSGRQWWSWVSRDDLLGILRHAIVAESLSGAVNATAPEPVTNAAYTKALGAAVGRPALFPIPKLGPALILGKDLTEDLLFTSARALPEAVRASGYAFTHPEVGPALRDLVARG